MSMPAAAEVCAVVGDVQADVALGHGKVATRNICTEMVNMRGIALLLNCNSG